jgi:hypothetical protein
MNLSSDILVSSLCFFKCNLCRYVMRRMRGAPAPAPAPALSSTVPHFAATAKAAFVNFSLFTALFMISPTGGAVHVEFSRPIAQ